jgi:hypothetical protein
VRAMLIDAGSFSFGYGRKVDNARIRADLIGTLVTTRFGLRRVAGDS